MNELIQTISLGALHQGSHYNFHLQTLGILKANNKLKQHIDTVLTEYERAVGREDLSLVKNRKSGSSERLREADRKRTTLFRGMRRMVSLFTLSDDAETLKAQRKMDRLMKKYRIDFSGAIDNKTGLMLNFVADLENDCAAETARLNMQWMATAFKAANAEVMRLTTLRTEEGMGQTRGENRKARRLTDKIYKELILTANARIITDGGEKYAQYAPTVEKMNSHIQRYKLYSIRRKSGKNGADADDLPTEPGPATPPPSGGEHTPSTPVPPTGGGGTPPTPPPSGGENGGTAPDPSL